MRTQRAVLCSVVLHTLALSKFRKSDYSNISVSYEDQLYFSVSKSERGGGKYAEGDLRMRESEKVRESCRERQTESPSPEVWWLCVRTELLKRHREQEGRG